MAFRVIQTFSISPPSDVLPIVSSHAHEDDGDDDDDDDIDDDNNNCNDDPIVS